MFVVAQLPAFRWRSCAPSAANGRHLPAKRTTDHPHIKQFRRIRLHCDLLHTALCRRGCVRPSGRYPAVSSWPTDTTRTRSFALPAHFRVDRGQGVGLQHGDGEILRVPKGCPIALACDLPGGATRDPVAQEAHLQPGHLLVGCQRLAVAAFARLGRPAAEVRAPPFGSSSVRTSWWLGWMGRASSTRCTRVGASIAYRAMTPEGRPPPRCPTPPRARVSAPPVR